MLYHTCLLFHNIFAFILYFYYLPIYLFIYLRVVAYLCRQLIVFLRESEYLTNTLHSERICTYIKLHVMQL